MTRSVTQVGHEVRVPSWHRRRILAAAIEEFAHLGFRESKFAHIASRASLPPSTVYYHFGGKTSLFDTSLRTVMAASNDAIGSALNACGDEHRLLVFGQADIAWWIEHPNAARFLARYYQRADSPAVQRSCTDWELQRHDLAFQAGDDGSPSWDSASRAARRRQSSRILRMRLALHITLATAVTALEHPPCPEPKRSVGLYELYNELIMPNEPGRRRSPDAWFQ